MLNLDYILELTLMKPSERGLFYRKKGSEPNCKAIQSGTLLRAGRAASRDRITGPAEIM